MCGGTVTCYLAILVWRAGGKLAKSWWKSLWKSWWIAHGKERERDVNMVFSLDRSHYG
jgi:hypothetical protein